ncbi:hypothetical protein JW960_09660 [candidate division KSB1 bacterium]|nr:hypothetical protein [candidate division KSB1 bacterium]
MGQIRISSLLVGMLIFLLSAPTLYAEEKAASTQPTIGVWVITNYVRDETKNVTPASEFNIKNVRIIGSGNPAPKWSYHLMGEFFSSTGSPTLMQAWVSYSANRYATFRFGQFKYPFGYEAYQSILLWKFVNPAYVTTDVVKKLGRSGNIYRDIGVELAGEYTINENINAVYKFMVLNGDGANKDDMNNRKDYAGFLGARLPTNILTGLSLYKGVYTEIGNNLNESALGLMLSIKNQRYSAQAEYIKATYKNTVGRDTEPSGYYGYITYMLMSMVEVGARYDIYEKDTNISSVKTSRLTLSTGYYFNKVNRILLNYEIRDNDADSSVGNLLTIQLQAAM